MKKLGFLFGLVVMATSLAFAQSNYELQTDGTYKYTGEPVNQLVVDFTTWATDDLPTPLADDMPLAESHSLGFVKWKIAQRTCGSKGAVNALFNNDNSDFGGGAPTKNNATTNKPRIYLPTTSASVANMKVFGGNGKVALKVFYKDEDHAAWTVAGNIDLTTAYAEQILAINSKGQTMIYIEYSATAWIALTDIVLEIEGAPTPVSDVQLNITKTQLQVGKTLTLEATVLPEDATDKTVTWASDAPAIASVENGLVTAVAPGIAHITAMAGVKVATCEIEVKDKVVYATGVEWNVEGKALTLNIGDSAVLTYSILPEDATEREVILSSSNPNCVRIKQDGKIYADGGGSVILTATLGDFSDQVTVTVDDPNMPKGELDWDQDGTYWGDSVNYVYENFNEWPLTALRDPITSEDIQQYKKLGFIRWQMKKRATLIGIQQWDNTDLRTSLFTDNPEIDGYHTTDSAHYAMIYLPTLKYGAGAIRITGYASTSNGNPISMQLSWYNREWSESQAGYTWIKGIQIPADGTNVAETGLDIEEPVTIQIAYLQSVWPSIWSIQVSPYGYPLSDDPDTDFADLDQGLSDVYGNVKALKMMVKGQLIIVVNGQTYNVQGIPVNLK